MLNALIRRIRIDRTNVADMTATRGNASEKKPLTLADLRPGQSGRIVGVSTHRAGRAERLIAYGLVRGQVIRLVQKNPAFVIRVEETELALDAEVARGIRIDPLVS